LKALAKEASSRPEILLTDEEAASINRPSVVRLITADTLFGGWVKVRNVLETVPDVKKRLPGSYRCS